MDKTIYNKLGILIFPLDVWGFVTSYLNLKDATMLMSTCKKLYKNDKLLRNVREPLMNLSGNAKRMLDIYQKFPYLEKIQDLPTTRKNILILTSKLPRLTRLSLDLKNFKANESSLFSLTKLTRLNDLSISFTDFINYGKCIEPISLLTQLASLRVSGNPDLENVLYNMTNITSLCVTRTPERSVLSRLVNLVDLDITSIHRDSSIKGIADTLTRLTKLGAVNIEETDAPYLQNIKSLGVFVLPSLTNLETLSIRTKVNLDILSKLTNLIHLKIYTPLHDYNYIHINKLTNLNSLVLNSKIFPELRLPKLESLGIRLERLHTDIDKIFLDTSLAQNLPLLTSLVNLCIKNFPKHLSKEDVQKLVPWYTNVEIY